MSKKVQQQVGRRIRDVRVCQGITQSQLALMTHMTKSYMCEIEAGKKNLTLRTLAKIAECLDVTVEDLVREDDGPVREKLSGGGRF